MSEWYYARNGQQCGPVTFEQLLEAARSGGLNRTDLVWSSSLKDWTPAERVEGLFTTPAIPAVPAMPAADPANPYATPPSSWVQEAPSSGEIVPGSEALGVGACIIRGFDLTVRHFAVILLVGLVYLGVSMAAGVLLAGMDAALGLGHASHTQWHDSNGVVYTYQQNGSPLSIILTKLLSTFLALGVTRIGLNLVSGKAASVGMLFGEGGKWLRGLVATLLFGLMVAIGLLLLIVPGIYLALRYGFFLTAIVDRDLGIMDAFAYSSSLTTNNRMNLFLLALLAFAVTVAGMLACCVGLFFAIPVVWLGWLVAYRWLQFGHRAALDHPGTTTPQLTGV